MSSFNLPPSLGALLETERQDKRSGTIEESIDSGVLGFQGVDPVPLIPKLARVPRNSMMGESTLQMRELPEIGTCQMIYKRTHFTTVILKDHVDVEYRTWEEEFLFEHFNL